MSRRKMLLIATLVVSILLNLIVIPFIAWQLFGYSHMYRRNVCYAAELAYAVGYHKALGNDLAAELEWCPTRLKITKANIKRVEAVIWPAKGQVLHLEFTGPAICNATINEPEDVESKTRSSTQR